jgi:glycosyltransferase involved in cell wall biosynthesis
MPGYTLGRRPVKLVFSEHYEETVDAIAAERRIKGWSRAKKEGLYSGRFRRARGAGEEGRKGRRVNLAAGLKGRSGASFEAASRRLRTRSLGRLSNLARVRQMAQRSPRRSNAGEHETMALTDLATLSSVHPSQRTANGVLSLSAAVICLNEAACIGKCLESLRDCAEIVVLDSGSSDGTLAIVDGFVRRGFPIRLVHQPWLGYARQKQHALDLATQPWVFSIDADEWLDDDLRASLPRLMAADESVVGWKVRRSLTLYGQAKPVSRWTRPEHILRLVRQGRARFDPALIVHEGLVADHGETPIARDGVLRHERSLPLNEQMKKEITYARLKAEQRLKQGRKPSALKLVFNPPIYFLRIFFWNRFFLCGWPGFIHAGVGAMYSLMTESIHRQLYKARAGR